MKAQITRQMSNTVWSHFLQRRHHLPYNEKNHGVPMASYKSKILILKICTIGWEDWHVKLVLVKHPWNFIFSKENNSDFLQFCFLLGFQSSVSSSLLVLFLLLIVFTNFKTNRKIHPHLLIHAVIRKSLKGWIQSFALVWVVSYWRKPHFPLWHLVS